MSVRRIWSLPGILMLGLFGLFHPDDGEEIRADILALEQETLGLISDVVGT